MAKAGKRRRAREWVLRALYAGEMREAPEQDALSALLEEDPPDEIDEAFARRLYDLARSNEKRFDPEIEKHLKNWDLARLALIDLLLIRCALAEMEGFPDVPNRVTLDETIELAKRYSGGKAGGFVNGVLDGILKSREGSAPDDQVEGGEAEVENDSES